MRNEICEYASEARAREVRDLLANLFGFQFFVAQGGKGVAGQEYKLKRGGALLRLYMEEEEVGKGPNRRYRVILEARKA